MIKPVNHLAYLLTKQPGKGNRIAELINFK